MLTKNKRTRLLAFFPIISCVVGIFYTFKAPHINWDRAIQTIATHQAPILHDPAAKSDLIFFGNGQLDTAALVSFYDTAYPKAMLKDMDKVSIATLDRKSYQYLSMEQMWNSASDSRERLARIEAIYQALQREGFRVTNSYASHPLIIYSLERDQTRMLVDSTINAIPWYFAMPYCDLELPVEFDEQKFLGWYPLAKGETLSIGSTGFTYFIQAEKPEIKGPAIRIRFSDGQEELLQLTEENDPYRRFFTRSLPDSKIVFKWEKRPLVSSSYAYPGSILPSNGYIFQWGDDKVIEEIEVLRDDLQLNYVLR